KLPQKLRLCVNLMSSSSNPRECALPIRLRLDFFGMILILSSVEKCRRGIRRIFLITCPRIVEV
ncbi:MAG: hypothetical protein V4441_02760, partial [Pseudomonadota bacterium]